MSTVVVGAGLSGLMTAINIRLEDRGHDVVVVSGRNAGNTRVAGQRYRTRLSGRDADTAERDVLGLLAARNGGVVTYGMTTFVRQGISEVRRLQELHFDAPELPPIVRHELVDWFGPQLGSSKNDGSGRGGDVLATLAGWADALGVRWVNGTAVALQGRGRHVDGVVVESRRPGGVLTLRSGNVVLAGGNPGGAMFHSTNVPITMSPHELAVRRGLSMVDASTFMFHIFGSCRPNGESTVGCFETDLLAGARIFLKHRRSGEYTVRDEETEALLDRHAAHYEFDSIARRILRHGGMCRIVTAAGERWARVAHHYSHIAIETVDGVTVTGLDRVFAVGDAAGVGHGSGHRVRYPGIALTNCLVTARVAASKILDDPGDAAVVMDSGESAGAPAVPSARDRRMIRDINTGAIFGAVFGAEPVISAPEWRRQLYAAQATADFPESPLWEISILTAHAVEQARCESEPIFVAPRCINMPWAS
jgi:hypothetical protein